MQQKQDLMIDQDLLVELGTEELPPMSLLKMSESFGNQIKQGFLANNISFADHKCFATPRRIAVLMNKVVLEVRQGQDPDEQLGCSVIIQLISKIISKAILNLPSPKMHWGLQDHVFARPVHWILALFGRQVINLNLLGVASGQLTYGHRFLANFGICISEPKYYEDLLLSDGKVVADFNKRKNIILALIRKQEAIVQGQCMLDHFLLEQVTNMVEYPGVLVAKFDPKFLALPLECLQTVMKTHQKSFVVKDHQNKLLPLCFLITNMPAIDPVNIIAGNERVIHARLQDAMFLYKQDLAISFEYRIEQLQKVVVHHSLGNLQEQSIRIGLLAEKLCQMLGGGSQELINSKTAGALSKNDLVSKMVLEFPELQGVMGGYYYIESMPRSLQKNPAALDVSIAIQQHYFPRFATDLLPDTLTGSVVSIAYRADFLCGMFLIGAEASGDQDPFGLRRHAVAIIRILIEKNLHLNLQDLFELSIHAYSGANAVGVLENVLLFCKERLKQWYLKQKKIAAKFVNAVLPTYCHNVYEFDLRLQSLIEFFKQEKSSTLLAMHKRITKILDKNQINNSKDLEVKSELFLVAEESLLFKKIIEIEQKISQPNMRYQYGMILQELVNSQLLVENFFEQVMVIVPEIDLRDNRLKLLKKLQQLFLNVADLTLI